MEGINLSFSLYFGVEMGRGIFVDREIRKKRLIEDVEAYRLDWQRVIQSSPEGPDKEVLGRLAQDTLTLEKDLLSLSSTSKEAELLHFALNTPWGAPFHTDKTLLELACQFDTDPSDEELACFIQNLSKYTKMFSNQYIKLFTNRIKL